MENLGKSLIIFGVCVVAVGALLLLSPRIPWLGKLPGDIMIRRENFTFSLPLTTSLLLSLLLTLLVNLLKK